MPRRTRYIVDMCCLILFCTISTEYVALMLYYVTLCVRPIPCCHASFLVLILPKKCYRLLALQLGFKTAVGMPFKDIATADSVFLEQLPASDDKAARTAMRRMQEVGHDIIT